MSGPKPKGIRGLLRRVRRRVGHDQGQNQSAEPFSAKYDSVFAKHLEDTEVAFQLVGAAIVSTWEVALTDMASALRGRLPAEEQGKLIERMSDGIVPLQQALQSANHRYRGALQEGLKKGLASGKLVDVTDGLTSVLLAIDKDVAKGWKKTVTYLEPVVEAVGQPDGLMDGLNAGAEDMATFLDAATQQYHQAVSVLVPNAGLNDGMRNAIDDWSAKVVRGFEVSLYGHRSALVAAAKAMPPSP